MIQNSLCRPYKTVLANAYGTSGSQIKIQISVPNIGNAGLQASSGKQGHLLYFPQVFCSIIDI